MPEAGETIQLSTSAHEILLTLKKEGAQTTKTLAGNLKMTVPGVRQHLLLLETQKQVVHYFESRGVSRPSQLWKLSAQGHAAKECMGFCQNELDLFRASLGTQVRVERKEYLLQGGRRCTYSITKLDAS